LLLLARADWSAPQIRGLPRQSQLPVFLFQLR
jgi:hypothetical protein